MLAIHKLRWTYNSPLASIKVNNKRNEATIKTRLQRRRVASAGGSDVGVPGYTDAAASYDEQSGVVSW